MLVSNFYLLTFVFQPQATSAFGFTTKSSVPFTIHEDDPAASKNPNNKKLSEKAVENQKPLVKNEAKVILELIYERLLIFFSF